MFTLRPYMSKSKNISLESDCKKTEIVLGKKEYIYIYKSKFLK